MSRWLSWAVLAAVLVILPVTAAAQPSEGSCCPLLFACWNHCFTLIDPNDFALCFDSCTDALFYCCANLPRGDLAFSTEAAQYLSPGCAPQDQSRASTTEKLERMQGMATKETEAAALREIKNRQFVIRPHRRDKAPISWDELTWMAGKVGG